MHPIFKLKDMFCNNVHHVFCFFFSFIFAFDSLCHLLLLSFPFPSISFEQIEVPTIYSFFFGLVRDKTILQRWLDFDCVAHVTKSKEHLYLIIRSSHRDSAQNVLNVCICLDLRCVMTTGSIYLLQVLSRF